MCVLKVARDFSCDSQSTVGRGAKQSMILLIEGLRPSALFASSFFKKKHNVFVTFARALIGKSQSTGVRCSEAQRIMLMEVLKFCAWKTKMIKA